MKTKYLAGLLLLLAIPAVAQDKAALRKKIIDAAAGCSGRVGVAVKLLETGDTLSYLGTERFPMQSVYKLPISMAMLDLVDKGKWTLAQEVKVLPSDYVRKPQHSPIRDQYPDANRNMSVSELLRYNVSESDGSACDVLLRLMGGPGKVQQYLTGIGIRQMMVRNTEKEIGGDPRRQVQYRNWTTPQEAVRLLEKLYDDHPLLSAQSRAQLLKWITNTPTSAKRIKGQLPAGTEVAHKTGTDYTVDGLTGATNDIGVITLPDGRHLAVAIFIRDSRSPDSVREGTMAVIARLCWEHYK